MPFEARTSDEEDFDDGLGDDLMGDEDDRARLMAMTEVERERVLAERADKRAAIVERRELKQKLRASQRRDSRGAQRSEKNRSLSELKARREKSQTKPRPQKVTSKRTVEEEEGLEEVPTISITLADISMARISRGLIERWIDYPFFAEAVRGLLVRVGIGMSGKKAVYRVAEVVDVVELPRTYHLGEIETSKYLELAHGASKKVFRISFVSNSDITPNEFERWIDEMRRSRTRLPTRESLVARRQRILDTRNHVFTHEEINQMLQEKAKRGLKGPKHFTVEKSLLIQLKEAAETQNNHDEARRIFEQITALESAMAERKTDSKLDSLTKLNQRNRLLNKTEVRQVADNEHKNSMEKGSNDLDPFARRRCKPMIIHFSKKSSSEREGGHSDSGDGGETHSSDAGQSERSRSKAEVPAHPATLPPKLQRPPIPSTQSLEKDYELNIKIDLSALGKVRMLLRRSKP